MEIGRYSVITPKDADFAEHQRPPRLAPPMENDRPVALALLTQTQLDMLGISLKRVFRIGDGEEQFADMLRALNESDASNSSDQQPDA